MNISSSTLDEYDGSADEDRPDRVDQALSAEVKVGYGKGLAVVEPPGGYDDVPLGGSGTYDHYLGRDELIRPTDDAKQFLTDLFDGVGSLSAASDETNIPEDRLRTAANLHSVEMPDGDGHTDDRQVDVLELPGGEQIPRSILDEPVHSDKLILSALICDGLSTSEIARYLGEQTDTNLSARDIWRECVRHSLLDGELPDRDDDRQFHSIESGSSVPDIPEKRSIDQLTE